MKLNELSKSSKATITVHRPGERVDLATRIDHVNSDSIVLDAIRKDNKIVSFKTQSNDLQSDITVLVNGCPLVWKNVSIEKITLNNEPYYSVRSRRESEINERRRAQRVPTVDKGFIQMGSSHATPEVLIKNASRTGFALVINSVANVRVGDNCKLTFYDENRMGNSKIVQSQKYDFHCVVRRMEPPINGKMVLGVSIPKSEQPSAGRLIRAKQA